MRVPRLKCEPGKRIELAVCKALETQVSQAKKRDAAHHCWNKVPTTMLRLSLLASSLFAAVHADVSFTPGPGLKKNPDGTYSRTYDAQAEGAAAGENEGCLLYTSPSPRDGLLSRMPSSA